MFGYIRTDEPFLYKKDETLYNACYCGLCFAIKKLCGQKARLSLTYDVAFLSVLLHNLSDADVEIENKKCAVHPFKKRKIAKTDEVFLSCAALNVILAYYKAIDDIDDEKSSGIKNALKKSIVKKGYYKAKKVYPEIYKRVLTKHVQFTKSKTGRFLEQAQKEGFVKKDIDEEFFLNIIELNMIYSSHPDFLKKNSKYNEKELKFKVLCTIMRGISSIVGVQYMDSNMDKWNKRIKNNL